MKARLLNFIACPHDRHYPLRLHIFRERPRPGTRPLPRCELHCGLRNLAAEQVTPYDCQCCADTAIDDGVLICDECRRWFPIADGIPTLFPDELREGDDEFIAMNRNELAELGLAKSSPLIGGQSPKVSSSLPRLDEIRKMQSERHARDAQAGNYDRLMGLKIYKLLFEEPAYTAALRDAPAGPIFEAGCGTGRLTDVFTALTDEVVAADFSLASIRRNRARHANNSKTIHYLQCDLTRLPMRDNCVSAIAHAGVYEHLPSREARQRWLQHAKRVLQPGGKAMISAYRYGGPICRRLWKKEGEHAGGIPFIRFTEDELKAELKEAFEIKSFKSNLGIYLSMAVCERRK